MAEQFGFEHRFRQRRTIDLDERALGARRQFVDRLGDQLLAGAGFPAQQHGGIGFGDDHDLVEQGAECRAVADDALDEHLLALPHRLEFRQFLLQAVALGHQAVAIARDDPVELNGLADQIGDHREEADIGIQPEYRPAVPDPVDGHGPDDLGSDPDRNADERHPDVIRRPERDRIGRKQRMGRDILDDQGHRGRHDLPDRRFRQARAVAFVGVPSFQPMPTVMSGTSSSARSEMTPCRICRNDESTLSTLESVVSSRFGALRILEIS